MLVILGIVGGFIYLANEYPRETLMVLDLMKRENVVTRSEIKDVFGS